jgi:hypothetical protein
MNSIAIVAKIGTLENTSDIVIIWNHQGVGLSMVESQSSDCHWEPICLGWIAEQQHGDATNGLP